MLVAKVLSGNLVGFVLRVQRVAAMEATSDIISLIDAPYKSSLFT